MYTRRESRTERLRRECRVRGRDGGKVREAVETKGQRRGTRSVRGSRADDGADSFDSVRLELAGFGEYGSFVVGRGAPRRLETAAAVVVVEAEPSGMKPPLSRREATWSRRRASWESKRDDSIHANRRPNRPTETGEHEPNTERAPRNYGRTCCS